METPRTLVPVSVDTYRKPYLAADGWPWLADLVRDSCQAPLFIWRACNAPGQHLATPTQDAVAGVGTILDPVLVQQDRTAQRARLHPTMPVPGVSRLRHGSRAITVPTRPSPTCLTHLRQTTTSCDRDAPRAQALVHGHPAFCGPAQGHRLLTQAVPGLKPAGVGPGATPACRTYKYAWRARGLALTCKGRSSFMRRPPVPD